MQFVMQLCKLDRLALIVPIIVRSSRDHLKTLLEERTYVKKILYTVYIVTHYNDEITIWYFYLIAGIFNRAAPFSVN